MNCNSNIPKVTVMIPTYNQAGFVRDAIESALAQTYHNLEVIVGDDASTDETFHIASGIVDHRLKCVRNPVNLGRTANYRNLLYKHATGDFVVNLDGDDYLTDSNFIAEAINTIMENDNVVMVVAKVATISRNRQLVSSVPSIEGATGMQIIRKMPRSKYRVMHMGVVYARKPALEINFYRSSAISSDWESLYRLALRGNVRYLDRIIGVWRIHDNNETGTTSVFQILENLTIWQSVREDAISCGMSLIQAFLFQARCVAYMTQSYCPRMSMAGNLELLSFLRLVVKEQGLSVLIGFLDIRYAARVILCFLGFYRRASTV